MNLLAILVDHSTANRRPIVVRAECEALKDVGTAVRDAYGVHCAKYEKTPVWNDVELRSITVVNDSPRRKKGERR